MIERDRALMVARSIGKNREPARDLDYGTTRDPRRIPTTLQGPSASHDMSPTGPPLQGGITGADGQHRARAVRQ
jgi:hypothetical protein